MNKVLIVLLLIFVTIFKMNQEELQQKIEELSRVVQNQGDKILVLENKPNQLDRLLDNNSKNIITETVRKFFLDSMFETIYYYNTWFDSADGLEAVGGRFTAAGQYSLDTTAVISNEAYAAKVNPYVLGSLDFTKESRFRVTLMPEQITNQTIKVVVGDESTHGYGFQISNATLSGFTIKGGTSTTKTILTITANTNYKLEARFFPNSRVDFIVNNTEYGSIDTNIPTDIVTSQVLWSVSIITTAAAAKTLKLGSLEYIQSKT